MELDERPSVQLYVNSRFFIANTGDYVTVLGLNETILGLNTIAELKVVGYLKVYCYLIE